MIVELNVSIAKDARCPVELTGASVGYPVRCTHSVSRGGSRAHVKTCALRSVVSVKQTSLPRLTAALLGAKN